MHLAVVGQRVSCHAERVCLGPAQRMMRMRTLFTHLEWGFEGPVLAAIPCSNKAVAELWSKGRETVCLTVNSPLDSLR